MLYYIDKNRYHFIKEYLKQFSRFGFQKVAHQVGLPNRHILEILLARRQTLVAKTVRRVLGYSTARSIENDNVIITAQLRKTFNKAYAGVFERCYLKLQRCY